MMMVFEIRTPRYPSSPRTGRQNSFHAHGPQCLRHDEKPRLDGCVAEARLIEQRQQEWHATDAEPGEQPAADGDAEGANCRGAAVAKGDTEASSHAASSRSNNASDRPSMLAISRPLRVCSPKTSSTYDSSAIPEPNRISPTSIERMGFFGVVGQVEIDHNQPDNANGNVQEEDDAPMEVTDDQAARNGPEHGRNQGGNRDEAHNANQVGLGERAHQREPANRHHERAAHALQRCGRRRGDGCCCREPQSNEPKSEQTDGGGEDAARSEAIGHPAADRNEYCKAERVAGEHGLHGERSDVQRLGDRWNGGVQNSRVQRLHEERDRDQPGKQPLA